MDVLVSPGGQIQCRRRQVREQAWKDVVFKLERDRNFPPVFPRGDLHVEPAKRETLRQKERSAFRDELAWHATFMSIVVIEAGTCPMGILNAKSAGKSQEREDRERDGKGQREEDGVDMGGRGIIKKKKIRQ